MKAFVFTLTVVLTHAFAQDLPEKGLMLDLNAAQGVSLDEAGRVLSWQNQIATSPAKVFVYRDEGRKEPKSGCPTLRKNVELLGNKPALVFRQQELVCMEEDVFDSLITGSGHTWIALVAVHEQRVGLKDVNSFFGNLRNGAKYEGVWGCFNDDNTLWWGTRNGLSFGRFDQNNPQVMGPKFEPNKFYLIAGRMGAGQGTVKLELFVNEAKAYTVADFPVNPSANPSRMAVGQERDAIEHPGFESFDGEMARLLIWGRPLSDEEFRVAFQQLKLTYFSDTKSQTKQ